MGNERVADLCGGDLLGSQPLQIGATSLQLLPRADVITSAPRTRMGRIKRASVLECGGPPPLLVARRAFKFFTPAIVRTFISRISCISRLKFFPRVQFTRVKNSPFLIISRPRFPPHLCVNSHSVPRMGYCRAHQVALEITVKFIKAPGKVLPSCPGVFFNRLLN